MEVAAPCLLLLMNLLDSGRAAVSLSVSPRRLQFFKYERFSVSCEDDEEQAGWSVMKRNQDGEVHPCSSTCSITAAFTNTDSGVYWCETKQGATSSAVNITVTAGSVVLDGPVLPVTEGDNVTLRCRTRSSVPACSLTDFYKDGLVIRTNGTANLTLSSVSRSDEGLYRCRICGLEESPQSWLTVRAPPAGPEPPALSVFMLVRHLLIGTPYLVSTIILGLIYRDRRREQRANQARRTYDDVIMQIVT